MCRDGNWLRAKRDRCRKDIIIYRCKEDPRAGEDEEIHDHHRRRCRRLRRVVEKWVKSGRTGAVEQELDVERSRWPVDMASGREAWLDSAAFKSITGTIPSTKEFHLKTIVINNRGDGTNEVYFYDKGSAASTGTVSVFGVPVQGSTFNLIEGDLAVIQSQLFASVADSYIQVRVAGILITSFVTSV